jgi:hypothetical protein
MEGIVITTDSLSIITDPSHNIVNTYESVNKIFQIEGLPVGIITWGIGNIGAMSIELLIKEFQFLLRNDESYKFDINISLKDISQKFYEFIYNKHYIEYYQNSPDNPKLGFLIVGYSTNEYLPEGYAIEIENSICGGPKLTIRTGDYGEYWNGIKEPLNRLVNGYSDSVIEILRKVGVDENKIKQFTKKSEEFITQPFALAQTPINELIDIAQFLMNVTYNYIKYSPGAPTVGGVIDIAVITKHDGFKWIQKKKRFIE